MFLITLQLYTFYFPDCDDFTWETQMAKCCDSYAVTVDYHEGFLSTIQVETGSLQCLCDVLGIDILVNLLYSISWTFSTLPR